MLQETLAVPTESDLYARIRIGLRTVVADGGQAYVDRVMSSLGEVAASSAVDLKLYDRLLDELIALMLHEPIEPDLELDLMARVDFWFTCAESCTQAYRATKKKSLQREVGRVLRGAAPLDFGHAVEIFERVLLLVLVDGRRLPAI